MPTLTFTTGNDNYTLNGNGAFDLNFLAGDDILSAYYGDEIIAHMGDGNDLARLLISPATVFGDAGNDRFEIYASNSIIDGGADSDTINIRGGNGTSANGGSGADRFNIYTDSTGVLLDGGDGNDTFYGYNHIITGQISGGAGNDYFVKFYDGVALAGGTGNDIYRITVGHTPSIFELLGEGTDSVQVARGASYVLPDNVENISVQGFAGSTTGAASLWGNALNNAIIGHNNAEEIMGGAGNDRISAQGGNDTVWGGEGNDVLVGGTGTDVLHGESGNDTLRGAGTAIMDGGTGNDLYYIDSADDVVTELSGEGTDTVRTFINYTLTANVENGIIQNTGAGLSLTGNSLNNALSGSIAGDTLAGLAGNDILRGGGGPDSLDGGDGDDIIVGGFSADTMTGGAGADTFVYTSTLESQPGDVDHITLFQSNDVVDVSAIDADINTPGDQAFVFAGNEAPSNFAGDIWINWEWVSLLSTVKVTFFGDVDGDGVADITVVVDLMSLTDLQNFSSANIIL